MDRCCCRFVVFLLATAVVVLVPTSGAYRATSATTSHPSLLTSSSSLPPAAAAAANCLKHCVCKWKGGKESITCHQAAGLTSIPALGHGGESTVQWLDLSGNAIGQLGAEQFRKNGLVHLQRIVLQRCSIRTIERTALWGLTNLVELDLSHNALTSIPSGALQYAPELRELKLNGNAILKLSDSVLVSGTKLVRLELANCQISQIDHKAFQGLEMLEWLRLDGNLIDQLSTYSLGPMRSLRGIDLHHNPWNCSCQLRPLRTWLAARNMPFSVPPLCLQPVRLRGQSWNRIGLDELACPPRLQIAQSLVKAVAGQPVTLTCQVQSNPEAEIMWFFADRLIANLTSSSSSSDSSTSPSATLPSASSVHQVYYLRESGERTDRTSELVLAAAREQDSGIYACQATNRAERVTVNATILVKPNPNEMGGLGRGLTAGLILALFAVLVACLLVCCLCSLKRARLHASLRNRRPSNVMGQMGNGFRRNSSVKFDQNGVDPLFHLRAPSHSFSNGHLKRAVSCDSMESARLDSQCNGDHLPNDPGDKQWLVSTSTHSDVDNIGGGPSHRQIAMYSAQQQQQSQNKVSFNRSPANSNSQSKLELAIDNSSTVASDRQGRRRSEEIRTPSPHTPPYPPQPSAMPRRSYPDLVDESVSAVDVRGDQHFHLTGSRDRDVISPSSLRAASPINSVGGNDMDLITQYQYKPTQQQQQQQQQRRRRTSSSSVTVLPPVRYLPHRPRRRLSDWELNELDQDLMMDDDYVTVYDVYDDDDEMVSDGLTIEPVSPMTPTGVLIGRRHSIDDFGDGGGGNIIDEDTSFHRRYAYHTGQLNRFLLEYRTLQKRLALMQSTWNQCLDGPQPPTNPVAIASRGVGGRCSNVVTRRIQPQQPMPLRPILKNRHQPQHQQQQQKHRRWVNNSAAVDLNDDNGLVAVGADLPQQQPQQQQQHEQQSVVAGGGSSRRRLSYCDIVDEQYFG